MIETDYYGPKIILADLDGSSPVELYLESGAYPVPVPKAQYAVQFVKMRDGDEGAGLRCALVAGANDTDPDVEIKVAWLAPDLVAAVDAKFYRQPASAMRVSIDGGSSWKLCVFLADGWQPESIESSWRNKRAVIKLALLGDL